MTNAANDAYSAWPERIYIIDESGRIAYAGGMGPFKHIAGERAGWRRRFGEVHSLSPQRRHIDETTANSPLG